MMSIRKVSKN